MVHHGSVQSDVFIDLYIGKVLVIFCTALLCRSRDKSMLKIKCETIDFPQLYFQ